VLDTLLANDPASRAGVETTCTTDYVLVCGETRSEHQLEQSDIETIARQCVRDIGYDFEGFNWNSLQVDVRVHTQSPDIARGVDAGNRDSEGAGDQGIMFGFACDETADLMPAPIHYSHRILEAMAKARKSGDITGLKPDSKSQVTMSYENGVPVKVDTVLVSSHHDEALSTANVRDLIVPIIKDTLPDDLLDDDTTYLINPTGRFVVGGPVSDTGLTGRKIIVDTYGGAALHGGGAFSGKDPTKVDRSAAYAVRYLAKNVVAAGLAKRCTIQIAYAIGVPDPVSLYLDTDGTAEVDEHKISDALRELVDLRPRGIIRHLSLDKPIYKSTAAYGHYGRTPTDDGAFSWERLDLVDELKGRFS
jgi:S-adenosylmethionine synthetase